MTVALSDEDSIQGMHVVSAGCHRWGHSLTASYRPNLIEQGIVLHIDLDRVPSLFRLCNSCVIVGFGRRERARSRGN